MQADTLRFIRAREATGQWLDKLHLDAYLYEVEPRANGWQVRIECATSEGWQSLVLELDGDDLLATAHGSAANRRLEERLRSCRRRPGAYSSSSKPSGP